MQSANENLQISPAGLALIKKWEGWYPKAYKDPVGVWTIGYGTTGAEARPGRSITKAQGEAFLLKELDDDQASVKRLVKVPLNQFQFDALVSFVYNVGSGNLSKSTLLKLVNAGNFSAAAGQFARWNKARDRETGHYITLRGLTNRRSDEAALFRRDPSDQHSEDELNMEKQEPLVDPNNHDANVVPDTPPPGSNALGTLVKASDTVKAVGITLTGLVTAVYQLIEPLKDNPVLFGAVFVIASGLGAVVAVKLRDLREER